MDFLQNVSLAGYSTMGLGGNAAYLAEVTARNDVTAALTWAQQNQLPTLMIGGGSNIIWSDNGYPGLVLINKIPGYTVLEEDDTNTYLTLGSGENWDSVVERSVSAGLTGIEALSLIPGTVGATPIQNVSAYGQEISNTLVSVEAFDTQSGGFLNLANSDCAFGYRTSRFKTTDRGRFYITGILLHLTKGNPEPPFYGSVQKYFEDHGVTQYTPAALREAVIAIRNSKLPNPSVVHNAGSFFINPLVSDDQLINLQAQFENLPHWELDNGGTKLSAAWLIEQAGFKDFHDKTTGMATWPLQPLVFVNEHAQHTADLLAFKLRVVGAVQSKFGITLQQEPELLPHETPSA
jgi:UDP-N-acetylmuramate dehydrogenase